jgi:hypothetical protein
MAQIQKQSISQEQFLTIAINLVNRALLELPRTEAKNLFRELSLGRVLPLSEVRMEDGSLVRFDLALDHSEYVGRLNFGGFRGSVALLLSNTAKALQEKQAIQVFSAEHNPELRMFGITAVTVDEDQPNVMVLGSDTSSPAAHVQLKLLYLEPGQFAAGGSGADRTA